MKYWYKFRQTSPRPPGQWIVCGPYDSCEAAAVAREKSKAWDCEVGNVFPAASKEEAEQSPL
jgi:hypothetical protein